MSEIILHHFDISPFAEKIRLVLGMKRLTWHSVEIPVVMPKPDLTALTGGYRKTPVLQIGADIYCDTQRIALELERRWPQPSLFPDNSRGLCLALANWSDVAFFRPGAALSMGTNTELPEPVLQDRRAFFSFLDFDALPSDLPQHFAAFEAQLSLLQSMLADRRQYLLGDSPSWADILAYFPVWMCRGNIRGAEIMLERFPGIAPWEARVAAWGHGQRETLSAAAALAISRAAAATARVNVEPSPHQDLAPGDRVSVSPEDYGAVAVDGELMVLTIDEVAIRRQDERAGETVVHFPRAGYRVEKEV